MNELARRLCTDTALHLLVSTGFSLCLICFGLARWPARLRHNLYLAATATFLVPFGTLAALGTAMGGLLPRVPVAAPVPDFSALLRYTATATPTPGVASHQDGWAIALLLWAVGAAWLATRWVLRRGAAAAPTLRAPDEYERDAVLRAAAALGVNRPVRIVVTPGAGAPAVAGILHPTLLLPDGIRAQLDDAELSGILMHEMAHVRRRDNLAAAVVRLVVTVFWFFPLVWWLERKLAVEREFASDELALGRGAAPERYASGLLKTCRLYWAGAPAGAAAATGSHLAKRLEGIMSNPYRTASPAARLAAAGLFSLMIAAPLASGLWNGMQAPAEPREKRVGAELAAMSVVPPGAASAAGHAAFLAQLNVLLSPWATPKAAVAPPYEKWLDQDVAYIITPEEHAAFVRLTSDPERDRFIEQFWQRRNPAGPNAAGNRYKKEHYRRITYANDRFAKPEVPGWQTDRGRLYIVMGPPDEIDRPAERYETWFYRQFDNTTDGLRITFHI